MKFVDYLLGGATTPMAGDGRGVVTRQISSSKSGPISSKVSSGDTHSHDRSSFIPQARSSPTPQPVRNNPLSRISQDPMRRKAVANSPTFPPTETPVLHGPLASTDTTDLLQRPSQESFRTCAQNSAQSESPRPGSETPWQDLVPWQEYEIPPELEIINDNTPPEIRNIVQESLDEHRAIRDSRLQAQACGIEVTSGTSAAVCGRPQARLAESSITVSTRSTVSSESNATSDNSGQNISLETVTSIGSNSDGGAPLEPPQIVVPTSAEADQASLESTTTRSSGTTAMERKFQESKAKTSKSRRLFKHLPSQKMKSGLDPGLQRSEPRLSECIGCFDEMPSQKAIDLPCRHSYCKHCFTQLVSATMQSEASFPPKCCLTGIPKTIMRAHLPPKELTLFEERTLEYAVPIANRYYCVSAKCARWIDTRRAKRTHGSLQCPHCTTKLCTVCRGPQHSSNQDCPQDFALEETLERAEMAGWRRCYNCRAMVELNTGCRHITCKCRAEFW